MDPVKVTGETYNQIASDYTAEYFDYYKTNIQFLDMLSSKLRANASVLDVGCASGGISEYLTNKGFQVTGIDISSNFIEIAKNKVPKVKFQVMDMRSLDFPNNSFDGIMADYSLHHLPKNDIPHVLKEFRKVLRNGGVLYASLYEGEGARFITEPFNPELQAYWSFLSG